MKTVMMLAASLIMLAGSNALAARASEIADPNMNPAKRAADPNFEKPCASMNQNKMFKNTRKEHGEEQKQQPAAKGTTVGV